MNFKITGRDFKFFIIGVFAAFAFVTIYDWEENIESFKKGFKAGMENGINAK